ncbi:MAG: hypothetical protein JXB50_10360 [Spirochaetes bacterium]|nr:hypothetical protein [Spirochaetota bacterium]
MKKLYIYFLLVSALIFLLSFQNTRGNQLNTKERSEIIKLRSIDQNPNCLNINMAFFPQAPYADWALPYQEACEEASVLLTANSLKKFNLDLKSFDAELLKLIEWEKARFGDYLHTNVKHTEIMIREYFNLRTKIHKNPTFEDIASIIAKGNLIIAPFSGKLLDNPYFTNGGPRYHMLVIKGYNKEKQSIITHDVGTRRGADFVYSWDNIQESLHDWHNIDMKLGEKLIIEVSN